MAFANLGTFKKGEGVHGSALQGEGVTGSALLWFDPKLGLVVRGQSS